jgi:quinoprotein glucose dehydrogenase
MSARTTRILAIIFAIGLMKTSTSGQSGTKGGEWPYYAGDAGSTKYSPLDQINKDNVKDLQIAWRWKAENFGPRPDYYYEATPLMVGGVLYTTAGSRRDVVAIDGASGETLWMYRYDEGIRGRLAPIRSSSGRGVAYWTDGREARILHVTPGYHLVSLDAKTGRPDTGFGKDGVVDLYEGLDRPAPKDGEIGWNSPAIVVRNTIVVGSAMPSLSPAKEAAPGHVRGFDVRTGKRNWIFHTIPKPGEFGNETWENDSWVYTGQAGVWAPMSADEQLGYVYLPIETPTNDRYGGHRLGNNLFGETLVCLDVQTGKRVWHFQFVHHGLWDYDIPTAPTLVDLNVGGRPIKAVAQITKQGWTYVFNRVTGEPVWPIEERAVPQSDVPGERTSPTQPFPTKPPAFDRQGVTEDDLIDFTPALKAEAIKIASQYRFGPLFTPPIVTGANGVRGVLQLPTSTGGANWQGGAVDAETGILYVASVTSMGVAAVVHEPRRSTMDYIPSTGSDGPPPAAKPSEGASRPSPPPPPVVALREYAAVDMKGQVGCGENGPQGLPLVKPPYGRITAVDLNSGTNLWMVANGDTPDCVKNHPALKGMAIPRTGSPDRSGIMVTKTLMFAGEGAGFVAPAYSGGPMFRAYDKKTGAIVSEFRLPANQTGVPMTYMINDRQYIAVSIGGRNQPAELVALTVRR